MKSKLRVHLLVKLQLLIHVVHRRNSRWFRYADSEPSKDPGLPMIFQVFGCRSHVRAFMHMKRRWCCCCLPSVRVWKWKTEVCVRNPRYFSFRQTYPRFRVRHKFPGFRFAWYIQHHSGRIAIFPCNHTISMACFSGVRGNPTRLWAPIPNPLVHFHIFGIPEVISQHPKWCQFRFVFPQSL